MLLKARHTNKDTIPYPGRQHDLAIAPVTGAAPPSATKLPPAGTCNWPAIYSLLWKPIGSGYTVVIVPLKFEPALPKPAPPTSLSCLASPSSSPQSWRNRHPLPPLSPDLHSHLFLCTPCVNTLEVQIQLRGVQLPFF